jgi:hypothetical protein
MGLSQGGGKGSGRGQGGGKGHRRRGGISRRRGHVAGGELDAGVADGGSIGHRAKGGLKVAREAGVVSGGHGNGGRHRGPERVGEHEGHASGRGPGGGGLPMAVVPRGPAAGQRRPVGRDGGNREQGIVKEYPRILPIIEVVGDGMVRVIGVKVREDADGHGYEIPRDGNDPGGRAAGQVDEILRAQVQVIVGGIGVAGAGATVHDRGDDGDTVVPELGAGPANSPAHRGVIDPISDGAKIPVVKTSIHGSRQRVGNGAGEDPGGGVRRLVISGFPGKNGGSAAAGESDGGGSGKTDLAPGA